MSPNPFFAAGPVPPQYFVGRSSEITTAFDQISKCAHLAIYGSPGIGKSSFLRYLSSPQVWQERGRDSSQAFIISLNCTGINPFTPCAFWREVLSLLKDEAGDDGSLGSEIDAVLKKEAIEIANLRQILRKVGKQNKFLVLLLDDFDKALLPNDNYTPVEILTFLEEFRDLAVHRKEGRCLSTIVSTFRRLNELGPPLSRNGSPWYNHYLFQPLKSFPEGEVASLFFRGESKYNIPLSSITLRPGILDLTGGHPALLQNAGYLLYETHQDSEMLNIEAFTTKFTSRTEQFFDDTWRFSTDIEQVLLMLIALSRLEGRLNINRNYTLSNIDLIFSQRSRELIDLEERGVIKHIVKEGKKVYAFTSSMMEFWVIREIENTNEEELEKREKVFLKLMSRDQVEQVKNVFREVWKYREALQSVVIWIIRKLAGDPT